MQRENSSGMSGRERDLSIDFMRAFCAVGIIAFHFFCHTEEHQTRLFYEFANGSFGNTIVNMFFLISGAMLYYNYPGIKSLKSFYYKRFKSIYPMFYIAFLAAYFYYSIRVRDFFYGGNPAKLLLTLFGLDGYFLYLAPNYYQVGEWFLGAIVMLYAIYPVLLKVFNKSAVLATVIAFVLYGTAFLPGLFRVDIACNMFSCLISFELGMVLMRHRKLWKSNLVIFIVSLILSLGILFIKMEIIPRNIFNHLLAICLFFVFSYIGGLIMRNGVCLKVFSEISKLSFAIFLVQHIIINFMLGRYMPANDVLSVLWLTATAAVSVGVAKVLTVVNNVLLKSKAFQKIDACFLK